MMVLRWLLLPGFLLGGFQLLTGQEIDFAGDVAPIIYKHCTPCHQENGPGPMPFTNFAEVVAYGAMIAYVTRIHYMPPWKADRNYGHWDSELKLSDEQIESIQQWAAAGYPEGEEEKDYEPPVREEEQTDWDLILEMDTTFEQYGIYFDQFQVFRLPTGLTEDRWVEAIGFEAGDATIVRYVSVSLNTNPIARRLDEWDPRYGYTSFGGPGFRPDVDSWYSWAIGDQEEQEGQFRRLLPAGAELILYVHYGPTGSKKLDRSRLKLKFASEAHDLPVLRTANLINPQLLESVFKIPAGETKTWQTALELPIGIKLRAIEPQALLLNQSWEIFARMPGGKVIQILKISDYDLHWRRKYWLSEPLDLPVGTKLHARAVYDNRVDNPFIPVSPPVEASWGARIYEEQFLVHCHYESAEAESYAAPALANNQSTENWSLQFLASSAGEYQIDVQPIGSNTTGRSFSYFSPMAGPQGTKVNVGELPYGNYLVSITDPGKEIISTDLVVYWSPRYTKSLLDE